MIVLYTNGATDHYSQKIKEWFGKYGIEFSERYISQMDISEHSKILAELKGVQLKGPTISAFGRVWSYLEVSKRPRIICEELIWLGSNNDNSI
jgi:hypothetical protein